MGVGGLGALRALAALAFLFSGSVQAAPLEADMARRLCVGMILEYRLSNGARVDCLSPDYAIEVDWTEKWAEAIGQALYYAAETDRKPAVILICHQAPLTCLLHIFRFETTVALWRLPITTWRCEVSANSRADCLETRR